MNSIEKAKRGSKKSSFDGHSEEIEGFSGVNSLFGSESKINNTNNKVETYECSGREENSSNIAKSFKASSPKELIKELEKVYSGMEVPVPKRDRLHNNLLKALRKYLQEDFNKYCTEFGTASNQEKVKNYNQWLTSYIQSFFNSDIDENFNQSLYGGKWNGFQFIFGSFISRETMKQMISSSREKAYFYGLQKCFKNSSQKKLAIMLKNDHLVYMIEHLFSSGRIREVLRID